MAKTGNNTSQGATPSIDQYWQPAYDTLYEAYFQELLAEFYLSRWQRIDFATTLLVSATVSSSAIAGWQLWGSATGKLGWLILAGVASVLSIAHSAMRVPARLKEQERTRKDFCELRVDLEDFRTGLSRIVNQQTESNFKKLRERYGKHVADVNPDLFQTISRLRKIQKSLDQILKGKGVI